MPEPRPTFPVKQEAAPENKYTRHAAEILKNGLAEAGSIAALIEKTKSKENNSIDFYSEMIELVKARSFAIEDLLNDAGAKEADKEIARKKFVEIKKILEVLKQEKSHEEIEIMELKGSLGFYRGKTDREILQKFHEVISATENSKERVCALIQERVVDEMCKRLEDYSLFEFPHNLSAQIEFMKALNVFVTMGFSKEELLSEMTETAKDQMQRAVKNIPNIPTYSSGLMDAVKKFVIFRTIGFSEEKLLESVKNEKAFGLFKAEIDTLEK
jgi:hypothetical protein